MKQIFHNPELQRIDVLDNRYYKTIDKNGKDVYFPSVTTILEIYPKGFGFNQWMKDVGNNAEQIAERAANIGSKIHQACELLNQGHTIDWLDKDGSSIYDVEEWKMLLNYMEFWQLSQAELICNETNLCSINLGFGGTLDLVVTIEGKRWLIDIKTSNYIHTSHELQIAAYSQLWNESHPDEIIDNVGILWLKANTRTQKKDVGKNIFQGVGWQLKTFDRHYGDAYKIFHHTHAIWLEENPNYKPANLIYPDKISLANILQLS